MTELIGRQRELDRAEAVVAETAREHGRCLLITAPEGMGKTRLVHGISARSMPIMVFVWGQCSRSPRDQPMAPWRQAWRQLGDLRAPLPDLNWPQSFPAEDDLLIKELAAVICQEARDVGYAIVLEDLDQADAGTLALLDLVLSQIDTTHLLIIVTADMSKADPASLQVLETWRWSRLTTHLPVAPLNEESIGTLLADWSPAAPPTADSECADDARAIASASRGNPRLAKELLLWTAERAPARRAGWDVDHWAERLARSMIETVTRKDAIGQSVLGCLAVSTIPVSLRLLAEAVGAHDSLVRRIVHDAETLGLVMPAPSVADHYKISHSFFVHAIRTALAPVLLQDSHRALARAYLAVDDGQNRTGTVEAARHLLEAGDRGPEAARLCLAAALLSEADQAMTEATALARWGLLATPTPLEHLGLYRVIGRSAGRRADRKEAGWAFDQAMALARTISPTMVAEVVTESFQYDRRWTMDLDGSHRLARQALNDFDPSPSATARLRAILAMFQFREDPQAARINGKEAVGLARASGDPHALAFTLSVLANVSIGPARVDEISSIGVQCRKLGPTGVAASLFALGTVALARGDRAALEMLCDEIDAAQRRVPNRLLRGRLALFRAATAVLDCDDRAVTEAIAIAGTTDVELCVVGPMLGLVWREQMGRRLEFDQEPESSCLLMKNFTALWSAADSLIRAERGDAAERRRLSQLVTELPSPEAVPDGMAWSAWMGLLCRIGVNTRNVALSRATAEALTPYQDQFLIFWSVPLAPAGWFVASALELQDRIREALEANRRAEQVSRRAGAEAWIARCLIQKIKLLRRGDHADPAQGKAVTETVASAVAEVRFLADRVPGVVLAADLERALDAVQPKGDAWIPDHAWIPDDGSMPDDAMRVMQDGDGADQHRGPNPPDALGLLTRRQVEILKLASAGLTNLDIATKLNLSVPTIERHFSNSYRRLGVRNRAQAIGILTQRSDHLRTDPKRGRGHRPH